MGNEVLPELREANQIELKPTTPEERREWMALKEKTWKYSSGRPVAEKLMGQATDGAVN